MSTASPASRGASETGKQTERDDDPNRKCEDRRRQRPETKPHQQMADGEAVAAEGDRAVDHRPAFGGDILRAVLDDGDAERGEGDGWCGTEEPRKTLRPEHVACDREGGDDQAAGNETHDI